MATSKINIFNALPNQFSDDEDDGNRTQGKGVQGKKTTGPRDDKTKNQKQAGATGTKAVDAKGKDDHKKGKGTPAPGSHPLERHSGTGHAAYDKKLKKGGAGKGNWGSNKNEKGEENTKEDEENQQGEEKAPEPEGITLEEYYSKKQVAKNDQINEAKAKVTSDQLMKELLSSKATVLQTRKGKEVDDHKTGKKKTTVEVDHHASLNTDHADLLNFRTGFIEREFRQRSDADKSSPTKRETRPREEKTEGQEKTEEQGEKAEGQQEEQGEKKERTGYKGDNRGDNRGQRGGKQGGRGGYKGNYNPQPKVNFEDESSFPKLG